jgi:hypothetical protein
VAEYANFFEFEKTCFFNVSVVSELIGANKFFIKILQYKFLGCQFFTVFEVFIYGDLLE